MRKIIILISLFTALCFLAKGAELSKEFTNKMFESFNQKHSKKYISEYLHYSTTSQMGEYVAFFAAQGFITNIDYAPKGNKNFWDRAVIYTSVLSTLRSDNFDINDGRLEISNVSPYKGKNPVQSCKFNYSTNDGSLMAPFITACIHSPINESKQDLFRYTKSKEFTSAQGDKMMEIRFENIDFSSLNKTRIHAKGTIIYNSTKDYITSISFDKGYRDYGQRVYQPSPDTLESVTQEELIITFEQKDGVIYPQSATYSIDWVEPQGKVSSYIDRAPLRKDAIGTKTQRWEKIIFSNQQALDDNAAKKCALSKRVGEWSISGQKAPYLAQMWESVEFEGVNFEKITEKLSTSESSLIQQAQHNGFNLLPTDHSGSIIDEEGRIAHEEYIKWEKENRRKIFTSKLERYKILFGKPHKFESQLLESFNPQ